MLCQTLSQVGETLLKVHVEGFEDEIQVSGLTEGHLAKPEVKESQQDKSKNCGVLSTPPVRDLAKEYGIDINDVSGSGPDGRVLKEDVLQYAVKKGILEDHVSSAASFRVQFDESETHTHAPDGVMWTYEDKKVQLRYYS